MNSQSIVRKNGQALLSPCAPPDFLEFDPNQSFMISYGIDHQTHPRFSQKSLSSIAGSDADRTTSLFRKIVGLPIAHTKSYIASRDNEECTFEQMRCKFIKTANKVDINGIFVFHFVGHGLNITKTNELGLAPTDFDYTRDKLITGAVMANWLHRSTFQGRYVLFILDACYSGGLGEEIVLKSVDLEIPVGGIYVLTSCTANETSLVITAMGQSIFGHFLSTALFESYSQPGKLYLAELYENCSVCCTAFSTLVLSFDEKEQQLGWKMMQPEVKMYHLPAYLKSLYDDDGTESTDSPASGRFTFLLEMYDYNKKMTHLPDKCRAWLSTVSDSDGPLHKLEKRNFLQWKIFTCAVAAMTYSTALIYRAYCDKISDTMSTKNFFIMLLLNVVASIDLIHAVELSYMDVRIALDYYIEAIRPNKTISLKELMKFRQLLTLKSNGEESTDSNTASPLDDGSDVPPLCRWIPLDPTDLN